MNSLAMIALTMIALSTNALTMLALAMTAVIVNAMGVQATGFQATRFNIPGTSFWTGSADYRKTVRGPIFDRFVRESENCPETVRG